jgi:eukaryotic-like serine/threonine-protein kinase
MSFSIGDTVGDYRILEELGRGGMGRVFKVEHTITHRVEAMKVLAGSRPDAPQQAARSLREIQLQASLDHPNIAAVHNAFWSGEDLVLVMELIPGRSLRRVLEQGRVPLAITMDYAGQALAALSYAHAHGVIHRDISPGNMMIGPNGVLKLTDFGLAKGPGDARLSQTGAPLGSLWYMPPEQVRGSSSDARSDIYSLGAVLYELASGKKPFDGESAFAIMADQVGKPPAPPIEIDPEVPPALSAALMRALEKDPDRRFQTAGEFQQFLAASQSAGDAPAALSRPWLARSRALRVAAVCVCVALAAVGIIAFRWLHAPINKPAVANVDSRVAVADTTQAEPPKSVSSHHPNGAKPIRHKPAKTGPNIFRKALTPIWPLSKRNKGISESQQTLRDSADQ